MVYANHKNIKIPHLEGSYLAITLSLSLEASKASGSSIGAGYIMLRFIKDKLMYYWYYYYQSALSLTTKTKHPVIY